MKKIFVLITVLAIGVGLYEQSKAQPNVIILAVTVAVFMYGLMKLSAKVPSKHPETEEEHDAERG